MVTDRPIPRRRTAFSGARCAQGSEAAARQGEATSGAWGPGRRAPDAPSGYTIEGGCEGVIAGNSTVNVAPSPGVLVTSTEPP